MYSKKKVQQKQLKPNDFYLQNETATCQFLWMVLLSSLYSFAVFNYRMPCMFGSTNTICMW